MTTTNATFVPSTGVAIAQLPTGRWARFNATRNTAEVGASGACKLGTRIGRGSFGSFNEAARA